MNLTLDLSYVDKAGADYAKFKHWVDQQVPIMNGQYDYAFSATDAAYMYRLDGGQQYADLAVRMVEDQVARAEAAIAAGHAPAIAGDSFYSVGAMMMDLALVYDWCSSTLTASQKTRYAAYAEQVLFNLYNPNNGHWGSTPYTWSGWALADCANNYYYAHMTAVMFWAFAANSTTWKTKLRDSTGTGTLDKLIAYFNTIPHGGSEEGTGYGTSHMRVFFLLRVWRELTGQDVHGAHVDGSLRYWTHAVVPTLNFFAPIGDQSRVSEPAIFDYQLTLIAAGMMVSNSASAQSGAAYTIANADPSWMTRPYDYRDGLMPHGTPGAVPAELYYDATEVGALFNRSDWSRDAIWMASVCGTYNQSHAHQEQGGITMHKNGAWVTAPANIWSRSGIHQDTPAHNVVRFERNGGVVPQHYNTTCTKSIGGANAQGNLQVAMNLSPAYSGTCNWARSIAFTADQVTVRDTYTGTGVTGILQWHFKNQPTISGNTASVDGYTLTITGGDGTPANLSVVNMQSTDADYGATYRLEARSANAGFVTTFDITGTGNTDPPPGNQPPIADFTAVQAGLTVTFTDASHDPDGTISSRSWDLGDGTTATTTNVSHTYAAAGTYSVQLTVVDNDGAPCTVTKQFNVSQAAANQPPVANFRFDVAQLRVDFYQQASDPDGTISSYAWDFGDGTTNPGPSPTHIYAVAGTYNVSLTVKDNLGLPATVTKQVTVATGTVTPPANVPPIADFTFAIQDLTATFTDTSQDVDGTITSRVWTFGDGTTSTATNPSHTYTAAGTYQVSLKVTDNQQGTNTTTKTVAVVAPVHHLNVTRTDSEWVVAGTTYTNEDEALIAAVNAAVTTPGAAVEISRKISVIAQ